MRIGALAAAATAAAVLCLTLSACPKKQESSATKAEAGLTIAVIPKGTTHEFWKSVHAGAVKASREEGVSIVWKGPLKEDDLKAQIDVVESFTTQKVNGIALAPLSDKGLVASAKNAKNAGIPVLVFDSDLEGDTQFSFVATDNYAAGKIAGEEMVRLLGPKGGKIMVLRYQEGSASTVNREKGFLDAVKAAPALQIVSENRYAGATTETALAASENLLSANKASAGGVDGIVTPNESTTFGMLMALKKASLAGKIKFIGFDVSDKLLAAVSDGHIDGLVLQNPFKMGYLAVQTMAKHLRGQPVERRVDTGAKLLTKANADTPEMKDLVHPDLKTWLGE